MPFGKYVEGPSFWGEESCVVHTSLVKQTAPTISRQSRAAAGSRDVAPDQSHDPARFRWNIEITPIPKNKIGIRVKNVAEFRPSLQLQR